MNSWRRVPIRRIFRVVNGGTPDRRPENWNGDIPWATPADLATVDGQSLSRTSRTLTQFGVHTGSATVPSGALLVSTRAPIGYVVKAETETAFNQGCRGLIPLGDVDVRYFHYQLNAMTSQLAGLGQGTTFGELSAQALASARLVLPPTASQRKIADFLDAETARIDALVDKRQRMIALLGDRRAALVEECIRSAADRYGETPLKYAARRIEVGIVITPSAWYADEGVLALRGHNVLSGHIVLEDVVRITEEGHRLHRKSELRAGDVVVVRTGGAGVAAVVPPAIDGANCIDLVIVRPRRELLPKFLEVVLNSTWSKSHIEANSVGTIQSHFNVGAMKLLPIPLPPLERQREVVEELTEATEALDLAVGSMRRQIALLQERRQALITAAVAGEVDIEGGAA